MSKNHVSRCISALLLSGLMSIGFVTVPPVPGSGSAVYAAANLPAPSGISYTSTGNSVTLMWDDVSGADAYRIYGSIDEFVCDAEEQLYDIGGDFYFNYKAVAGTQYTIDGLVKNKTYHFVIAALDKNGSKYTVGERTGVIKVKTKSFLLPDAPSTDYTGTATSDGKTYYFKNGKLTKTGKGYMYFDPSTYEMKTGWVAANSSSYYFGSDGIMFTNGTYKIGGKTYSIGADGKAKVKSSAAAKATNSASKKERYPDLFDYGFYDASLIFGPTDGIDAQGYIYTDFDNALSMYENYLKDWRRNGYQCVFDETERKNTNLYQTVCVYDRDTESVVAIFVFGYDVDDELCLISVSYL